jgi:hypothetical protein
MKFDAVAFPPSLTSASHRQLSFGVIKERFIFFHLVTEEKQDSAQPGSCQNAGRFLRLNRHHAALGLERM